jgi:eukaryotic-like serine/threonine-protein kinase
MVHFSPIPTLKRPSHLPPGQPEPGLLGRFELRRILGEGAQSVVWLAFDPRLEREVAIKLMKVEPGADATAIAQWLQEARSVSRLTHPNIVPVFEADQHGQQPYLVFEYVPGATLAALIRNRGALPAAQAVALMGDVLDALVAAHAAGVIHRDLKPSNVLIDDTGRARVMDFGIAARIKDASGAPTQAVAAFDGGTPGYMSPEAAQGLAATPLMDIFSAGLVLTEMLCGKPLIAHKDAQRAIQQVAHEQLTLPADMGPETDDKLRAVLLRALARDPGQRHTEAQGFATELRQWLGAGGPVEQSEAGAGPASGNGTLDFLLRRMRHKSDFPALSNSVVRIQSMVSSDTQSIGGIANEILKDVALTNKLLRLVNSAHFGHSGGISTVSRAVSLIGFNGIRNMALSLVLLEHMQDKSHAALLKEEFLRSLMAGNLASALSSVERETEEAFIGAMFQNLGRLLADYYFPDEARAIRSLTANVRAPMAEPAAAISVLGLSLEALGMGVAKAWGLPEGIQHCMKKPLGDPPSRPPTEVSERLRWTALAANDMADIMLRADPREVEHRLSVVAKNYAKALRMSPAEIQVASALGRKKLVDLVAAMDIHVTAGSAASRLLNLPGENVKPASYAQTLVDTLSPPALHATQTVIQAAGSPLVHDSQQAAQTLAAGIQDITNAMVEEFNLSDVLRMILETMFRAMAFQRIIFCLRDPKTDALTGRFGLGAGLESVVKPFSVSLKTSTPDLFTAVCLKGADTLISDATEQRIAERLPLWYRKLVNAPTFLLLPVALKGKPFGLIYADKGDRGSLVIDDKELALLRTLRNQAVMAFKQSG